MAIIKETNNSPAPLITQATPDYIIIVNDTDNYIGMKEEIKSISSEYEKQIEELKKENEELKKKLNSSRASKKRILKKLEKEENERYDLEEKYLHLNTCFKNLNKMYDDKTAKGLSKSNVRKEMQDLFDMGLKTDMEDWERDEGCKSQVKRLKFIYKKYNLK